MATPVKPCVIYCFSLLTALLAHAGDRPPNVLLIFADDVGTDAVGCYGGQSHPTPHIDSLANAGMKFEHAYAMPVCHPSRICLMSGKYPFRFGDAGSKWGDYPKRGEDVTIAHHMRKLGYKTAVAGKWQLCMMKNDLQHPGRLGFDHWMLFGWHEGARYNDPLLYVDGKRMADTEGSFGPDKYVDFLCQFMRESVQEDTPFFA